MSEKQEIFKNQLYEKFFIELKKNENIDKETFYNSNFELVDYYELEGKNCARCVCGITILKAYILKSKILNKYIIIGSENLNRF